MCKKVQVRYTSPKNNILKVKLRSSWSDKNGTHNKDREIGDYDTLAVFCPENKEVYFINDSEFSSKTGLNLRINNLKKNEHKARYAEDYKLMK